jgi:hypothetical protein
MQIFLGELPIISIILAFPEPVPYAGDKRIFMAEQFYDIDNPARRKIHISLYQEMPR